MTYVPKELKETADVSRGRKSPQQILEYTVGFAIFCVASYFILGFIANVFAHSIPDSWEAKLQPTIVNSSTDDQRLVEIEPLLQKLLADLDTRDLPYRLQIMVSDMPNAFAVPGGDIYVTTGLFDVVENEAQLAFILAHEIGHHHHRHVLKRLGRSALFKALSHLIFGANSFNAGNTAISLAQLGYSREHELEADSFAHKLVQKRIPNAEKAFLVLDKLGGNHSKAFLSEYLNTHPHPEERITLLRQSEVQH